MFVSPFREDGTTYGTPTQTWAVIVGGDVYVRAANGQESRWYQAAISQKAGRVRVAGTYYEVTFEPAGDDVSDAIDAGYEAKYPGSPAVPIMQGTGQVSDSPDLAPLTPSHCLRQVEAPCGRLPERHISRSNMGLPNRYDTVPSSPQHQQRVRSYLMKHISLGGLDVSRIGLGAMTMAGIYTSGGGLDDAESIRAIHRAFELGVTHIDTAEVYGPSTARR